MQQHGSKYFVLRPPPPTLGMGSVGLIQLFPSLVLVQPWKTCPCLTERLLMGRKESNQTNKHTPRLKSDIEIVQIGLFFIELTTEN